MELLNIARNQAHRDMDVYIDAKQEAKELLAFKKLALKLSDMNKALQAQVYTFAFIFAVIVL